MASVEDIKKLADLKYAAQTTGVSTAALHEGLRNVGLDPEDRESTQAANDLLRQNGYNPGTSDFYGSQGGPEDEGLAIHYNAVQRAKNEYGYLESTQENIDKYKGKINPETGEEYKFIVNDNIANAELIRAGLEAQGKDPATGTIASTPKTTPEWQALAKAAYTKEYDRQNAIVGGDLDNSLQWANLIKTGQRGLPTAPGQYGDYGFGDSLQPGPFNQPGGPTPDPIPETVNDAITLQVQKPTYGDVFTPATERVDRPESGTFASPLATAGLSAVPETITVRPNYTGTTMRNITMPSQGQYGVQNVVYVNSLGQTITVTEVNGQPTTYIPPGYVRAQAQPSQQSNGDNQQQQQTGTQQTITGGGNQAFGGNYSNYFTTQGSGDGVSVGDTQVAAAEGGDIQDTQLDAMYRMASKFLGYSGPKTRKALQQFQNSSPAIASKMKSYGNAMVKRAAKGGMMRKGFQEGGLSVDDLAQMQASAVTQTMQPRQSTVGQILPQAADFVAPTAGQTVPQAPFAEAAKVQTVEQAMLPTATPAAQVTPTTAAESVQQLTEATQAAQGAVSPEAQVQAAQQAQTSVTNLEAAQGTAIMLDNPVQREIQDGELISGAADAQKAAAFTEQVQAAQATPTKQATVQGQLEDLMAQFEGGETPAWAAGSMRQAMATLSARGLGASSMAGQAVIQATMEAALPIAQIDAATQAQFEAQNLSNRQQRAMLAAQQRAQFMGQEFDQAFQARVQNSARIADIANMNFTAEQQVALENSRAANSINLENLNNRQAMVMAEAAALSQLDMANLNNRQQAAVQNAQNFMQMDMSNLSNEQQTNMFRAQQNIQALFTDQAAENAAQQFNATSENQTNQFFASLTNQTAQFNASQRNAMDQFNVNSVNALREFNSEIQQQRDLFNAQNGLIVAQANAQWRQQIATLNTAAQNESNMQFAQTMNEITAANMDRIWQRERDLLSYAFQTANNNADRATTILAQKLAADATMDAAEASKTAGLLEAVGGAIANVVLGG